MVDVRRESKFCIRLQSIRLPLNGVRRGKYVDPNEELRSRSLLSITYLNGISS